MKTFKISFLNFKRLLSIFMLVIVIDSAQSQAPDSIIISEPSPAQVCAANHFTASFNSSGTFGVKVNSFIVINSTDTIVPVCPPGGGNVNAVTIEVDSSANCIVTSMGNNEWSISDTSALGNAVIYYSVFVDCSMLNDTLLQNSILAQSEFIGTTELIQVWLDTLANDTIRLSEGAEAKSFISTDLNFPFLTKLIPPVEKANYKGTRDSLFLYFAYRNAGNAPANIIFNFHDSLNCGSYSLIGNPGYAIADNILGKDTLTYTGFTAGIDTSASIPDGDVLIIREQIVIDSCMPCNNDMALLTWRCDAAQATCNTCQENYQTTFSIDTLGARKVSYSRLWPTNAGYDLSCNGDTVNWWFKFENTGQSGLKKLNIILDYHVQGNNALTLIDTSSIQIIRSDTSIVVTDTLGNQFFDPSNCANCYHLFPSAIIPQCTAQIPYQFESFKFSVHDLRPAKGALPAQYLLLGFSTYRCATSDDSLLDVPKYFNEWAVGVTPTDECGDTLPLQNINSGGIYYNSLTGGISGESEKSEGIHQSLDLSSTVTNLTIPPGPGTGVRYGDKAQIAVDLDGITGSANDGAEYDHFGCTTPTQPFACNLKGFLKARIFCESGLLVADTNVFLNYNLDTLRPVLAYADTSNPFACDSGSYTFIFDLSLDTNAYEILNFGQFIFTMGSCCPTADPHADYKISFYLLADPAGNCYDTILGTPYNYNKLDSAVLAYLPLSSVQNLIEVSCPGCRAPGAVAYRYSIDRITYGLTDSDNDRISDTTLTPVDSNYIFFNKLHVKNSMHGDQLLDRLSAQLQDGDSTTSVFDPIPGYTYSQMLALNARLRYLQLLRLFPEMDNLDVRIEQLILYIDEEDTTNADTCYDCAAYGTPPFNFSTMAVLSVDTSQLNSYVTSPAADQRLFTFSDTILEYDPTPLPPIIYQSSDTAFQFHGFNVDQRYRLSVIYNVCGNFESVSGSPIKKESTINNKMWLTGKAQVNGSVATMPNDVAELDTNGWALDTIAFPGNTLINQHFADTFLFLCSTNGGRHFFYSNEQTHTRIFTLNPGNCDKRLAIIAESTIGKLTESDIFPFEFRRPAWSPVSWDIKLPPNYYFKNPVLVRTYADYVNHVSHALNQEIITDTASTVFGTLTDTCHITLSQLPLIGCLKDTVDNTLSAGDQRIYAELILQAGDSVCSEGANDTLRAKIVFSDNDTLDCENSSNHFCGVDSVIKSSSNSLPDINPNLNFSSSPNLVAATQPTVCWEITVANGSGLSVTAAYNVFIVAPNYSFLSNWTLNSNPITINTPFIITPVLNRDSTVTDSLCATFSFCLPDTGVQHLVLHWGWNCDSLFAPADSACAYYTDSIDIELFPAGLLPQPALKDSITLCQPFEITAAFSGTGNGSVFPLVAVIDSLQQGFSVVSCTGMIGGVIDTLTSSDNVNWNFPPGAENISFDTMYVTFTLYPDCDFFIHNDTLPSVTLHSIKYCGDTLHSGVTFGAPVQSISNPNGCTNCFTLTKTALQDSIAAGDTVSFEIIICGNNGDSIMVNLTEYLPSDFDTLPGSIIQDSVFVPAQGCDTIIISGVFNTPGSCSDPAHINRVQITNANIDTIASACVTVLDSCFFLADSIFADSTFSSFYPATLSNITIYVAGRFYVNTHFTLNNCTVYTNAGAQIIVMPPYIFTLDSATDISGCTNMWQGILLESESHFQAFNNSRVRDAEYGIYANRYTTFTVENSDVTECVTGIYTPPHTAYHSITGRVEGSRFGMWNSTSFKPDYAGQAYHGVTPQAGMELNNMVMIIGSSSANKNQFNRMNTGITGIGSVMRVINSEFIQMQEDTAYHVPYGGTAVVSDGSTSVTTANLTFNPLAGGDTTVVSCKRGVYTMYSAATISNLLMTGVQTGVYSTKCSNPILTTSVTGCIIYAGKRGIDFYLNAGTGGMTAIDNFIYMNVQKSIGISMQESSSSINADYFISCNYVENTGGSSGIYAANLLHPAISQNTVQFSSGANFAIQGISLNACDSAGVGNNTIKSTTANDSTKWGIAVNISDNSIISCNDIDSTGYGVYYGGICGNTTFRGNEMNKHWEGLHLNSSAIIGVQFHYGNRWLGSYGSGFGAVNLDTAGLGISQSEFDAHDTSGTTHHPYVPWFNTAAGGYTDWFVIDASGTPYSCPSITACNETDFSGGGDEGNSLEMAIAQDEIETVDYEPESRNMAQQYLFSELQSDTALLVSNTVYTDFKEEHEDGNIGKLFEAEQKLSQISRYDSNLVQQFIETDSLVKIKTDSIYLIDSLSSISPVTNYGILRINLINQINGLNQETQNLILEHVAVTDNSLTEAYATNSSIVPSELPETNQKFMNEIIHSYYTGGRSAIGSHLPELLDIANQCPYSGGKGVIQARVIVSLFNETFEYDDIAVCLQAGYYKQSQNAKKEDRKPEFLIIPNPASDKIEIKSNCNFEGVCVIEITDALGSVVIKDNMNCKTQSHFISTVHLGQSVYFIKLRHESVVLNAQKLIIAR